MTDDAAGAIDELILGLGHLEVSEPQPKTEIGCDDTCPDSSQEDDQFCAYTRYSETAQFDRFVAFQPNSATLWPGSIVHGADAEQGLITPLGARLAPVTFSVSLENIAGSPVGTMSEPSLSKFREERNRILSSDLTGATPAKLDFEMTEIHSSSQLSIALGASVSWPGGGEIAAAFDFESQNRSSRLAVNFTQAYYTIDIDTPARPSDFFADDVTASEVADFVGADDPPTYVQSITYGRRVIFTVESSESMHDLQAALSATYSGAAQVDADVSMEHRKTLQEAKIRAFVYGGSGADATAVIDGYDGLVGYIRRGGDYSKDSPGAPIAYKLAYLDNAVTRLAFTTEYAERNCTKNRTRLHAELTRIDHVSGSDAGGNIELYGYAALRAPVGGDGVDNCIKGGKVLAIWQLDTGQWVDVEEFGSWSPPSPVFIDVDDVAFGPEQKLCLFTEIADNDVESGEMGGDDYYGYDSRLLTFEDGWTDVHILQPRGDFDRAVDVHIRLSLAD